MHLAILFAADAPAPDERGSASERLAEELGAELAEDLIAQLARR